MINHNIRKANTLDASKLSQLAHELTPYIFEEEVPQWFEEELSKESFEKRILVWNTSILFMCKKMRL